MHNMKQWDTTNLPLKIALPTHWTKGQELCNRTACQTGRNVFMWNYSTKAYYCVRCARLINDACRNRDRLLCSIDEDKMAYEKDAKAKLGYSWAAYKDSEEFKTI